MRLSRVSSPIVLCAAVAAHGAIAIPGPIVYPDPPAEMPVLTTAVDDQLAGRLAERLKAVAPVKGEPNGELSAFGPSVPPSPSTQHETATSFFAGILPDDVTVKKAGSRFVLVKQKFTPGGPVGSPQEDSTFERIERFVTLNGQEYRVYGGGSSAIVELQNGRFRSTAIRWNRVTGQSSKATRGLTDTLVETELAKKFPPAEGLDVSVAGPPELAYYDDRTGIRPVYRVPVNVNRHDGGHTDRRDVFISALDKSVPSPPSVDGDSAVACQGGSHEETGISFDRYALPGESSVWLNSAQNFKKGLSASFVQRSFCILKRNMLGSGRQFVDGTNVSLIEAHGEAGCILFPTNACIRLGLPDGYGANPDDLQLLIVHSCEVIATRDDDRMHWTERWWGIFKGLHTVVGYRTIMNPTDEVSPKFAVHLANGDPMIRSWIIEAAQSSAYSDGSTNGRAAAITLCDHDHDAVQTINESVIPLNPDCLIAYWMKN